MRCIFKRYNGVFVAMAAILFSAIPNPASAWGGLCWPWPCDPQEPQGTEEPQDDQCRFGIWSSQETNIRDRVNTTGGDIGSDTRVEVGVQAVVNGDINSIGNVLLRNQSYIDGDVLASGQVTQLKPVTVTGDTISGAYVPPYDIEEKSISYGSENIFLYQGMNRTLAPGAYGEVHAYDGSTLVLTAGTYNLRKLIVEG